MQDWSFSLQNNGFFPKKLDNTHFSRLKEFETNGYLVDERDEDEFDKDG